MSTDIAGIRLYSLDDVIAGIPKRDRPSRESLRRLLASGKIRARKIGKTWFTTGAAVADYFGVTLDEVVTPASDARGSEARGGVRK
jgi:hypothetical protein